MSMLTRGAETSACGVEVFYVFSSDSFVMTSTYCVEVFYGWSAATATVVAGVGVSAYGVEVFYVPADAPVKVPAYGVEVFYVFADPDGGTPGGSAGVRVFGYAG